MHTLDKASYKGENSASTHIIVSPIRRRAATRWRRWRRRFFSRRRRRSSARCRLLLLLLIVLRIHIHVIRVAPVGGIRVAAGLAGVVCGILGRVIGGAGGARRAGGGTGRGCGGLGAISAVGVLGAVAALLAVVLAVTSSAVVALGRVFFEPLVLLFYVGEEVFAEFAGAFDFFWVRAAGVG